MVVAAQRQSTQRMAFPLLTAHRCAATETAAPKAKTQPLAKVAAEEAAAPKGGAADGDVDDVFKEDALFKDDRPQFERICNPEAARDLAMEQKETHYFAAPLSKEYIARRRRFAGRWVVASTILLLMLFALCYIVPETAKGGQKMV